jgi:hypothetical protein
MGIIMTKPKIKKGEYTGPLDGHNDNRKKGAQKAEMYRNETKLQLRW